MDGSRLRRWREHSRLTQDELGDRVGVSGVQVGRIETGSRGTSVATLERFACALDLSLADLLSTDPPATFAGGDGTISTPLPEDAPTETGP